VWLGTNNFGGDRDHDGDPENYSKEIWDRDSCTNFADNSRSCPRIFINFFEGWDDSVAANLLLWC